MSKNKKPSFSIDGLATHVDKFSKNVEENFNNMGMHINFLQQELRLQTEKFDYLINLLLKDKDFPKVVESAFTDEDFNKQYEPVLGKFYFDKENKHLVEVELLTKGYSILSSKAIEGTENFEFTFNNIEKGILSVEAATPAEALTKLKYKLRHPIEIIHG